LPQERGVPQRQDQSPDPAERRRHPRYAVELRSALRLADDAKDGPGPHEARTRDIGRGGMCLVVDPAVGRGETVTLLLSLSLGSGPFSEALELPARVAWCTQLGAPPSPQHQLGLAFDELSYHQIGELEMFLRFLQSEGTEELPLSSKQQGFDTSEEHLPEDAENDDA
jgi:Tfp pilus assembly protein PilZ